MGKRLYTLANVCSSGKAFHLILGYLLTQRQGNKRFDTHVRFRPLSSREEKLQCCSIQDVLRYFVLSTPTNGCDGQASKKHLAIKCMKGTTLPLS